MNKLILMFLCLLPMACAGAVEGQSEPTKKSYCSVVGDAPAVTTITTPHGSAQPHPDCAKLDETTPLGQDIFCCEGAAFDMWYKQIEQ